ncbi:MAG: O-antigen ligase family protein [Acidobacteriota bacterium]|nr:O-antigen ligase family protein [Acidobacteriota bacterium]
MANRLIFFIICAAIVLTTLFYGAVHQPILALFYIGAASVLLLWVFDSFKSGELRFSKSPLQIPLAAIILFGLVQVIPLGSPGEISGVRDVSRTISYEPFATKTTVVHLIALLIFFAAMLAYIDNAKRLRKIVLVITIFGFLYAFYSILQAVLSPTRIYGIYEPRFATPFGSFVNRHNFAAFMEMSLAVPLGLMFVGAVPRDKRLLYVTAIGLMGIALLLSGSRGGLVALLAEIFFLIILTTKTKGYGQIALKIGLGVALFVTIVVGSVLIGGESSLTRFAETAASGNITTNRTHIWTVTFDVIKNNLLFGAGLGAFPQVYTAFDTLNGTERVEQAHNDYLQILADAGIVGLIIGAFFVFWLFRDGLRNIKTHNTFRRGVAVGALAGCFAVFVHSIFDFVLHTTAISMMFLTLCALVAVSGQKSDDDVETSQKHRRKSNFSPAATAAASVTPIEKKRRN